MSEIVLKENERSVVKSTKAKNTLADGMGMFGILKDMGLIGLVIYTIWADGTKNTNDITTLKEADAALSQRVTVIETNYTHINDQLERLEELQSIILKEVKK